MKDKPIPAKILLTLKGSKNSGEVFIALSGSLYRQNLIFLEPREIRRNGHILELSIIFCDIFSFKNWLKNSEIGNYWKEKFDLLLSDEPKTIKENDLIIDEDGIFNCSCEKSDFYILQGRTFRFVDELTCSNCLGQVSYSKIPLNIEIKEWQTNYERIYLTWLESGIFEKEAYDELINFRNGKLNKEGEKIRKELSNYFKIPVYLYCFDYEDNNNNKHCLVCKHKGVESTLIKPNRICKKCNTIFICED